MRRPRFRPPGISLRTKLALLALCLLALPWVGYRYVKEMERLLLEGQEQTLIDTARAVATALHERPYLMRLRPLDDSALRKQAEEELRQIRLQRQQVHAGAAEADMPSPEAARAAQGSRPEKAMTPPEHVPSAEPDEIAAILQGLERSAARIWVVNREYRVLSLSGSLKQARQPTARPSEVLERIAEQWIRPALDWLIRPPREDFDDATPTDMLNTGKEIENALRGVAASRVRNTPDGRAVVVSAAHPIWSGDDVLGAVVVEETTNPILSLRNRALERLLILTLLVFALGAAMILWFATRLSKRIRNLRDEAENAIDAEGRVTRLVSGSRAGDEIGDLSRSFSAVLAKLGEYNAYLEAMASRLSHELRTPIAVVRSSLENLRLQSLPDDARIYIDRADDGVRRLSTILTRMSEATRLEQSLRSAERERYDLAAVVAGCVKGYRLAYPQQRFEERLPDAPIWVHGSPDLAAQMLDKLVANATDFGRPGTPVEIELRVQDQTARLEVANHGPGLPDELRGRLFDSMISLREHVDGTQPHLGLGLYIVRLIAEFHGGSVSAGDRADGYGVVVTLELPLA